MTGEITLPEYLEAGSRMAFVYHVAGMDWAATDDPEFAAFINSDDSVAVAYRKQLYGSLEANTGSYSADDVLTVCALDRGLGSQVTNHSKEGGVSVGSWNVKVQGEKTGYRFGSLFEYTAFTGQCEGLTGLNWMPDAQTLGVYYGVLGETFSPDDDFEGFLSWEKSKDFKLKATIEAAMSGGLIDFYLWCGSSCLVCLATTVTDDGDYWKIAVRSGQFNTPAERLVYDASLRLQITTAPISLSGNTGRLMSVPFGETEIVTGGA